jgi:hypothetical protein
METRELSRRTRRERRSSCPDDSELDFLQRIAQAVEEGPSPVQTTRISVFDLDDQSPDEILSRNDRRVGFTIHNDTVDSELLIRLDDKNPTVDKYFDRIAPGETRRYFSDGVGRWEGEVTALWRKGGTNQDGKALFTEFIG